MKAHRYKVLNKQSVCVYKCVTEHLSNEQVISQLIERFKYDKRQYRIYCNDILVHRLNYINDTTRGNHRIQDNETGDIFLDCHELADHLGVSYREAKRRAYTMFRYKLIQ